MPIYEYRCKACEQTFEVMQKVSDPPMTACIHCSGEVAKVISPSGLVFKGSGWYITDYSNKGKGGSSAEGGKKKSSEPAKASETAKPSEPAKTPQNSGNGTSA